MPPSVSILPRAPEFTVPMLQQQVDGVQAWTRATLAPQDWLMELDAECQRELMHAVAAWRRAPVALRHIDVNQFDLARCRAFMQRVKKVLDDGVMFAVVDRLDLQTLTADEARVAYWLLCSLMSLPVAQRYNGEMVFEVLDKKVPIVPGSGLRPTISNVDMNFHSDCAYHDPQPNYIALLCLGTPLSGGLSRVASVYTVHNAMLADHAGLLGRLYQPFWYDRYREHAEGESPIVQRPMLAYDGVRLTSRIALPEIAAGYTLKAEAIDAPGQCAIDALKQVFARENLSASFHMQRGQMQFVNNRHAVHSRSDFVDAENGPEKRHLVRIWMRNEGPPSFTGH